MKKKLRQDINKIPTRSSIAACESDVPSVHEIQNGLKMLDVDTRDTIFKQIHPLHLRCLYYELKHGHMVYLGNNGHVVMARSEGPNKNLIIAEGRGVRCALWSRSRGLDLPTNFSGPGWTWPAKEGQLGCENDHVSQETEAPAGAGEQRKIEHKSRQAVVEHG